MEIDIMGRCKQCGYSIESTYALCPQCTTNIGRFFEGDLTVIDKYTMTKDLHLGTLYRTEESIITTNGFKLFYNRLVVIDKEGKPLIYLERDSDGL